MLYPEIEFSTGTSWHQVASEYAKLSDDKLRLSDVEGLLAKLNLKGGDRNEIVRRIVAALHKNVRYTGIEFGESNLVPEFPSETLKRRYGDCKATLLVAMLRSARIPAVLALLDTGPGRDINTELPGIGLFDHARYTFQHPGQILSSGSTQRPNFPEWVHCHGWTMADGP